jgi:hypothetical protein
MNRKREKEEEEYFSRFLFSLRLFFSLTLNGQKRASERERKLKEG